MQHDFIVDFAKHTLSWLDPPAIAPSPFGNVNLSLFMSSNGVAEDRPSIWCDGVTLRPDDDCYINYNKTKLLVHIKHYQSMNKIFVKR